MDRNQAKAFYPILQAFAEGKVIETRTDPNVVGKGLEDMNDWTEMNEIEHWNNIQYRVKPEPICRPFANAKECWQEMQKHQPFGWVKRKGNEHYSLITDVDDIKYGISLNERSGFDMDYVWVNYTFVDGTQFGVKVEE
jgi:hypothetical protein